MTDAAAGEVVDLCRDLIRIDTTNTGDLATCVGERAAAEHVAGLLAEVGLDPQIRESAPGRASVVARFEGADPARGALLVHGHLDVLAVVRDWRRRGVRPPRDLVLAFTADEEAGSDYGARFLVRRHRELLDGCTEGIGEVGGFSFTVSPDLRLYLIQTAEKGIDWLRLTARGRPGHGSLVHDDNAVTALCEAVARLGRHRFPIELTPTVRAFLE